MGKKMFVLIVVLMSISLIGIIAVQLYWINNALESKKAQFKNDVQISLGRVTERINEKEERLIEIQIQDFIESKKLANDAQIKNYLLLGIEWVSSHSTLTLLQKHLLSHQIHRLF